MSYATDAGFIIGNEYEVVYAQGNMSCNEGE